MEPNYIMARCGRCHQTVPFDREERVCFCLYCGSPLTAEDCIREEPARQEPPARQETRQKAPEAESARDRAESDDSVVGIVQEEYPLPGRGTVITMQLEVPVACDDLLLFIDRSGRPLGRGRVATIEYEHTLLASAKAGMEVGLLIAPATLRGLAGSIAVKYSLR